MEQASLAGGGKRKRWISPYVFGTILLLGPMLSTFTDVNL
jgi:hypothetical protein